MSGRTSAATEEAVRLFRLAESAKRARLSGGERDAAINLAATMAGVHRTTLWRALKPKRGKNGRRRAALNGGKRSRKAR